MKSTLTDWKEISDVAKNVTQVVAIFVAAIWTYLVFVRTEGPLLQPRASARSDLVWQTTPDACIANFDVQLDNIGKVSFAIHRVELRVWAFARIQGDGALHFVDLIGIQNAEPFFSREIKTGPFTRRYPPGEAFHHQFEWVVRRGDLQELLFRIDFFERGAQVSSWHTASWSPVCQP